MLFKLLHAVFFLEFINPTAGFNHQTLAAGVEGMAFGANLHLNRLGGGAGHEFVATGAGHLNLLIFGMDTFFHICSPLSAAWQAMLARPYEQGVIYININKPIDYITKSVGCKEA